MNSDSDILTLLEKCTICPHNCGVNRLNHNGKCHAGKKIKLNIHQLHFWEEPVISGTTGSGTLFFSNCNLKCVFCQNYSISQWGHGKEIEEEELVSAMLELQQMGAHNINLVTPTHYTPQIISALQNAKSNGLYIPVVWNSNAYELPETIKLLEGLVDIYLPDLKYSNDENARKFSTAPGYFSYATRSILEMHRQVGHLKTFNGIAFRGLLIRILILPNDLNGIENTLRWIAENLGDKTHISLMGQYYPTYKANAYNELSRGISQKEYDFALQILEKYSLSEGFIQDINSSSDYTPDFQTTT